jgi:hypothetical protein
MMTMKTPDKPSDKIREATRFVRWRRAGVWGRIIDAFAAPLDAAV